jgi:AcrR family transcriptional regulator
MTVRFGQLFVIRVDIAGAMMSQHSSQRVHRSGEGSTDSAKRRQILDGARSLFLAQGFDAASMNAIAHAAGVSKGTLYVYFKSKEELFEAIVEEQCKAQAEQIFAFDEDPDVGSVLRRLGCEFVRFLCRPDGISSLRTVIAIADRMPELGARFYLAGPARGIAILKAYFEAQVARGVLKPHDCEVAAAQFIDACLSTTYRPMLFNFADPPDAAQISHVVDMAVRMFLAAYALSPGMTQSIGGVTAGAS